MTKPTVRIHNIETDEVIDREMTDAEYAKFIAGQELEAANAEERAIVQADKAALLAKLGITADEAKLLLS